MPTIPNSSAGNILKISQHSNGYPIMPEIDLELFPLPVARDLLREFFMVAWDRYSNITMLSFLILT
jgi:hypothetical protein